MRLYIKMNGKDYYYDPVEFNKAIGNYYNSLPKPPPLNLDTYLIVPIEVIEEFNNWIDNNKTKWYR